MKVEHTMILTLWILFNSFANASEPEVFSRYEVLANELTEATASAQTRSDTTLIQDKADALMIMGREVMDIYSNKFVECAEQFEAMKHELPQADRMPFPELREKFHNAVGLPAGPKHCYFGRAMIYYPFVSKLKLQGDFNEVIRKQVVHHFTEAAEHLQDIRNKLAE